MTVNNSKRKIIFVFVAWNTRCVTMMEMGLSDLTQGDPLKNDQQLETGAAPAIAGGCCFFPAIICAVEGENDENPMVLGPLGKPYEQTRLHIAMENGHL